MIFFLQKTQISKTPLSASCQLLQRTDKKHLTGNMTVKGPGQEGSEQVIKTTHYIIVTLSRSIRDIDGWGGYLCRAHRAKKDQTTPDCSFCCRLARDTEVSAAVPPDHRTAFLKLWDFLKEKFIFLQNVLQHYHDERCDTESLSSLLRPLLAENNRGSRASQVLSQSIILTVQVFTLKERLLNL